ncbi:MAG: hypothetical protein JRI68_25700 [Deltaproteobacteria bacterium]|nr:hypothetical protein [Deltaproteobacteria bacterium]
MHKLWTELGEVVGAPKRAGYRDAPQRVATGSSSKGARVQTRSDQEAAEAEAAERA